MFRYAFHVLPSAVADAPKAALKSIAAILAAADEAVGPAAPGPTVPPAVAPGGARS